MKITPEIYKDVLKKVVTGDSTPDDIDILSSVLISGLEESVDIITIIEKTKQKSWVAEEYRKIIKDTLFNVVENVLITLKNRNESN